MSGIKKTSSPPPPIVIVPGSQQEPHRTAPENPATWDGQPGYEGPHPAAPQSPFKGVMRNPGWLPDVTSTEVDGDDYTTFLEEAILGGPKVKYSAFNPGLSNDTKSWITGGSFPGSANPKPFEKLVGQILNCCRNYNAALWCIRRLHFHYYLGTGQIEKGGAPEKNKNGPDYDFDPETMPAAEYPRRISNAHATWNEAVRALNEILTTGILTKNGKATDYGFKYIWADVVDVNDYIVSIRILAQTDPPLGARGRVGVFQFGASESSHYSISSPFSSVP